MTVVFDRALLPHQTSRYATPSGHDCQDEAACGCDVLPVVIGTSKTVADAKDAEERGRDDQRTARQRGFLY